MRTVTAPDFSADVVYVDAIIARIEVLEAERDDYQTDDNGNENDADWSADYPDDAAELRDLVALMRDLEGTGGDEQWRGDWYPSHLIADRHFVDYVREMLEDCGTIPRDLPEWVEIDWRATARNVRMDYTSVDVDGRTFWTR